MLSPEMAEEFTIEPIQVEDSNIFENQTVIMNDDGSLQIIGAPSDNVAKNSATSMFSGKIKKGGLRVPLHLTKQIGRIYLECTRSR